MALHIIAAADGRLSRITAGELARSARRLCRGHGRLVDWWVEVLEGSGRVRLVATYEGADGWRACVTEVL